MATVVIPGQVLGSTSTHTAGPGTHVFESKIYASIIGSVVTLPSPDKACKPVLTVPRHGSDPASQSQSMLPVVGMTVLCRITRMQQRQASVSILAVDASSSTIVPDTASASNDEMQFQAILRREDVRSAEKDRVVMNEMFRVGDIVRATVISLGDERSYYISTAGNEFGVVVARSGAGNAMVPASWKEMRDVVTGSGEGRKVAKPA